MAGKSLAWGLSVRLRTFRAYTGRHPAPLPAPRRAARRGGAGHGLCSARRCGPVAREGRRFFRSPLNSGSRAFAGFLARSFSRPAGTPAPWDARRSNAHHHLGHRLQCFGTRRGSIERSDIPEFLGGKIFRVDRGRILQGLGAELR
jgi:hypothetical protein